MSINTHGMTVDFGKHKDELWTRVPASYLRWMANTTHSRRDIALAELERRGIDPADRQVEISGHAIDTASLRVRKIWHENRGEDEGLHAWLIRLAVAALSESEPNEEGVIVHLGVKLVFETGELHPILKTVMRAKKRSIDEIIDIPDDLNQTPPV